MTQTVWDIMHGRQPIHAVSTEVNEFFMAKEFQGWTLEYIRSMSPRDYTIFSTLAGAFNRAEARAKSGAMAREKETINTVKKMERDQNQEQKILNRNKDTQQVLNALS